MDSTLVLFHPLVLDHFAGEGHPERPERLAGVLADLRERPLAGVRLAQPRPATIAEVRRVHTQAHVELLEGLRGLAAQLDPDTSVSPASVDAAFLSAGAAMQAVEAVVRGETSSALALCRPPGHHAEAEQAMGFCLLGNVAIAAAHAREALGISRVLVLDWDVHHGNGTQHAFYTSRDVLFVSSHRFPFYPGTGALEEVGRGEGRGYSVNLPLPVRCGDAEIVTLWQDVVAPLAADFAPELVIVSAGFDAHRDDPLGGMEVSDEGFAALCGMAKSIADGSAGGRIALVLEGGYDPAALARSIRACLEVLGGSTPPAGFGPPGDRGASAIRRAKEWHRRYWPAIG